MKRGPYATRAKPYFLLGSLSEYFVNLFARIRRYTKGKV